LHWVDGQLAVFEPVELALVYDLFTAEEASDDGDRFLESGRSRSAT